MRVTTVTSVALISAITLFLSVGSASAQFGGLKKKAEEKAKKEAEKKVDPAKPSPPAEVKAEPAAKESPTTEGASTAAGEDPGKGVWLNYDFIPGNRVIFFDDLSSDQIGNFPQRLEFGEGNMEVAEWSKMRWLRGSTACRFAIPLPEALPAKFTIEFDMYVSPGWNSVGITGEDPYSPEGGNAAQAQIFVDVTNGYAGLRKLPGSADIAMGKIADGILNQIMHCRVMADGQYVKVYINETRVANVPKASFLRTKGLYFDVTAAAERPVMLANFRIASSDKTIYDALAAVGRVTTHGILFDSGSDRVRPESTPTLKEIGQMLKDHADLKLLIEGHTDNTGDDAANQTLSEKRAAAVREYLTAQYGIDPARLQSQGFGETKPVAGNDTPEGRQNNRRVELVKL